MDTGVERRWDGGRDVGDCLCWNLEGVDGGFAAVVVELFHEVLCGSFSLFFPFDP